MPLPGDGGTDRRRPGATRRDCRASTCRPTVIATADPAALRDATDLVIFARRPRTCARRSTARRAVPRARGRPAVGGQGPRARHAAADEPGHRRGRRRRRSAGSPRCRARTSPPRWRATCRRRRSSRPRDLALAERVVARLARRRFRLYVNEDILGVELCGALKNVVAIAAGAADELGFGDNGKAGLLTRGLAEMTRLGIAAGANPLTFAGLAGMGDLIATCGSHLSRNHRLGEELAKGRAWAEIEATLPGTAEGAYTVQAALALAERLGVEMPIAREVERALFEGKSVQRCLVDLLARESKDELADFDRWMARLGERPTQA